MKKLFILALILIAHCSYAQNYQCLQPAVKRYFTNTDGYLRGIRIDSLKTQGDSTIYYPYHTPRGYYTSTSPSILDSTGGSWLGKQVVQRADGTFLFDNLWQDTVVIKTQASLGDSWIFYHDTTTLYYQADLITVDTMTVSGSLDSVKKILITAHKPSGIVITDPVDSFEIILSKNNGFAQVFDLYTFPYHKPDSGYIGGMDFYLDKVGISLFALINLPNPTYEQLYNWNDGDVYEYSACTGYFQYSDLICNPPGSYELDTITGVDSLTGIKNYHYSGWQALLDYPDFWITIPAFGSYTYDYFYGTKTGIKSYASTLLIDTSLMPEEYKQTYFYYYYPSDSSYCIANPLYNLTKNIYIRGISYEPPFEVYEGPSLYKCPLGLLSSISASSDAGNMITSQQLLYYNRGGTPCGTLTNPTPSSVKELTKNTTSITLSPNPVITVLTIISSTPIQQLSITNYIGQVIYTLSPNSDKAELNVANLPPGMYLVKVNGSEVRKFIME